jgi:uncharacterized RDD family membrane protein YckC
MAELPPAQTEAVQPAVESLPDLTAVLETHMPQTEPEDSLAELAPAQSAAEQPESVTEENSMPVPTAPVETSMPHMEPDNSLTEPVHAQSAAEQPESVTEEDSLPVLTTPVETSIPHMEPDNSMKELPQTPSAAVQPAFVAEMKSAPDLKAASVAAVSQTARQARTSSPIAVDWRKKYYRAVLMKRAGAIFLDQILMVYVPLILLLTVLPNIPDWVSTLFTYVISFFVMPKMESSKWQGTIGKRILKLQITDRDGARVTFLRAFWRNIARTIVLYLYLLFPILLILVLLGDINFWISLIGLIPLIYQYVRFKKTKKLFHDEVSGTEIGERLPSSAPAKVAMTMA